MWLEAILSADDVAALLTKLTPVRIDLGTAEEERYLNLGLAKSVTLVPEKGVRIVTHAEVRWSVSVLKVPATVDPLQVLLRPAILPPDHEKAGQLAFHVEVEEADFKLIPAFVDRKIAQAINAELAGHLLTWNFTETLSHAFTLPASLHPLETLELDVAWGEVKVTDEALVFAVSFRSSVTRS